MKTSFFVFALVYLHTFNTHAQNLTEQKRKKLRIDASVELSMRPMNESGMLKGCQNPSALNSPMLSAEDKNDLNIMCKCNRENPDPKDPCEETKQARLHWITKDGPENLMDWEKEYENWNAKLENCKKSHSDYQTALQENNKRSCECMKKAGYKQSSDAPPICP